MKRSEFIRVTAGAMATTRFSSAQRTAVPQTHTYKTAGGCEIKADVYGAGGTARLPVVIWIHGGALISGSRKGLSARFHTGLLEQGFVVVSIDYRLAPETKLP